MKTIMNSIDRIGIVLAGAAIAVFAIPAAATEVRVSIGSGPSHAVVSHGWNPYMKAVEAEAKGSITFKMFLGGTLLPFKAMLQGLKDGVADAGFMQFPYFLAELPNQKLVSDLSMLGTHGMATAGAVTEFNTLSCADCMAEFIQQGLVYGGNFATQPYGISSKMKISTLDELKGKKLRSGGPLWNRWAAHVGAVAASMPANDMYDALSRGALDGTMVGIASLKQYNLWDVAKHITDSKLGTYHSATAATFGRGFWRNLETAQRTLLLKHLAITVVGTTIGYFQNDKVVFDQAPALGVSVHQPDASFVKATEEFKKKDLALVEEEATKAGIRNAKEKIATINALMDKWNKLVGTLGYEQAALLPIFNREIFSKLDADSYAM